MATTSVDPPESLPQPGEEPAAGPIHLDPDLTFPAFLRRVCEQHAGRTALVFGDETWTYRRLADEVTRMEAVLLGLGATKGTRIAILMGARPEWVVTAFAAMCIGAIAVPVSTYEPAPTREQLLRHSDAAILVLQEKLLRHTYLEDILRDHPLFAEPGSGPVYDAALPYLRHVVNLGEGNGGHVLGWDDALRNAPDLPAAYLESVEGEIHPTDDALIVYTSGTSGLPKGVIHAHRTLAVQFDRFPREFTITSDDVVWGTWPLFWSAGFAWVLGATFGAGATCVLQEHFEPYEALRLIEQNGVSVIHIVPSQVAELEEALKQHPADLSSIRILPRGPLEEHLDLPRDHPYAAACLGLTEMLTLASSIPWDSPLEVRDTTHGLPLPGTLIKIIDPETGETLPTGQHGEIALKGTTLMKGYNKVFPETYLDGEGYYRTKDAGYFDEDGYLHWTGRMSQLIRTNAANVSPGEVEAAIFETFDVKIAAVVGVPDPEVGEMVVACVVPKPGVVLAEDEVRAALKGRLASYKIPGRVFFFEESEVELTGSGKVVLSTLKSLVAARMESTEGGEGS